MIVIDVGETVVGEISLGTEKAELKNLSAVRVW